jgi:Type II secretion system (T2SS), protein N
MASGRRAVVLVAMVALAAIVEAVALAPATLLDARIARATGQSVRLADAEGTLWHGRGTIAAGASRLPIAWEIDVGPLLRGVVRVQIRPDSGAATPRAEIAATANGIALRNAEVTIPADVLAGFLGNAAPGSVAGDVTASADDLDLTRGSRRGEARLVWRGARIAGLVGGAPLDLGEVRSTAKVEGEAISGPLANEGGELSLRGEWKMGENDDLALAMLLTPRRADQAELKRALAAIGRADGDGWRVNWRVSLR